MISSAEAATETRMLRHRTTRLRLTRRLQAAKTTTKGPRYLHRLPAPSERRDAPRTSGLPTRGTMAQLIRRLRCRARAKEAAGKMERFRSLKSKSQLACWELRCTESATRASLRCLRASHTEGQLSSRLSQTSSERIRTIVQYPVQRHLIYSRWMISCQVKVSRSRSTSQTAQQSAQVLAEQSQLHRTEALRSRCLSPKNPYLKGEPNNKRQVQEETSASPTFILTCNEVMMSRLKI